MGPIFLVVMTNHVRIIMAKRIEAQDHWLFIASSKYKVRRCIERIGALKPYFKIRIVMCVRSPFDGASLLDIARNRHAIGIGNCDDYTAGSAVRLRVVWHSSLALWEIYAVALGPGS